jgi:drug/metabolite transporter (DMT)-like permease
LGAVIFGILSVGLAMSLVYYGLTKTEASLYSTTVAVVPLLTLLFASAHGIERLSKRGIAGGLLAVIGIALAVSGSLFSGAAISLPHFLAIIAGAACFSEAGIVVKLFPPCHPFATNAVAMSIGALMLAFVSLISGESLALPSTLSMWLALVYIVIGGTVGTFLLYLNVLQRWTATGASYGFVLIPVVTVVLATLLTEETISPVFLAGGAIVLLGVYVGALMPSKKEEVVPAEEELQARPGMPSCV